MAFLEPMIVKQKAVRDDKVAPLVPKEVFRVYPITAFFLLTNLSRDLIFAEKKVSYILQ